MKKITSSEIRTLVGLVDRQILWYESRKFTTKNDESRVAKLHELNVLWAKLVALIAADIESGEDK